MKINIKNLVSISEASQNFLKVARLVDEKKTATILKHNAASGASSTFWFFKLTDYAGQEGFFPQHFLY